MLVREAVSSDLYLERSNLSAWIRAGQVLVGENDHGIWYSSARLKAFTVNQKASSTFAGAITVWEIAMRGMQGEQQVALFCPGGEAMAGPAPGRLQPQLASRSCQPVPDLRPSGRSHRLRWQSWSGPRHRPHR